MQASVFLKVLLDKKWLTYIYFLVTLITCIQAALNSSIAIGGAALVGCALSYIGVAGFVGSYLGRRDSQTSKGTLLGIGIVAIILIAAGLLLAHWSGFELGLFWIQIAGTVWGLVGMVIALLTTSKWDVL